MKNTAKLSVSAAALFGLAVIAMAPAATAQPPATIQAPSDGALPNGTMTADGQNPATPANVAVQTVASSPVPDTPANRAKYGGPMSHAGKKTAPAGN
jgi:hypothetical protein